MKYLLIDPFNQGTSGVTTYCHLARERLAALGWEVHLLSRGEHETITDFRHRVAQTIEHGSGSTNSYDMVEAPETLAVTRDVKDASRLHIRLHGSRHFGAWLQGLPSDIAEQAAEQCEVLRARVVSAPSRAAVETHRLHFGDAPSVRVYPNPAPASKLASPDQEMDVDFLFLGRWQALKGAGFFEILARSVGTQRCAVACHERPAHLPSALTHLPVITPAQRLVALHRSTVVVIPSLFETASMVGLEALAAGRPVVTWAHLGLVEYASSPCIQAVPPWNLDDFVGTARNAREKATNCDFSAALQRINWEFDRAVAAISGPASSPWPPTRPALSPSDHSQIFRSLSNMQSVSTNTVFQRKLRKLMRDPTAYWQDSVVRRALASMTSLRPAAQASIPAPPPAPTESQEAGSPPKRQSVHLVGKVPHAGFVKLKAPAKAPAGWRVCLVHAVSAAEQAQALLEQLQAFEDFGPFRRERLNLLEFEHDPGESLPDLIGRFDQKNKEALSQLDHLLLLDVPSNLAAALHHSAPNLRSILISSDPAHEASMLELPAVDHAGTLVCVEGTAAAQTHGWCRKVVIQDIDHLPMALLRVVRETGPKERDMLLQICGAPRFRPEFHDFNPNRYQGLIRLRNRSLPKAQTLRDFIRSVASEVDELYVLESVYMRYRSLVNEVEAGASADHLIEACLRDGVLFDVA